ncbi:MAG: hypothetical protein HOC70_03285 [Gammaproteobacteria bacterium]|jgi:hypothetical protein|nr:hypothetical protein [Gammaproteobacteria bacterium]MBT4492240.1 hypothetical protein [Gammaproteobacteria bacterium]MBT7369721.1 hypothetical protein [Gammaproteobacteria bacterium]
MNTQHLAAGVLLLLAVTLNWMPDLDLAAETYLSAAMTDNLIIYATARTLNGLISVIQSIQLSISVGAGMGVNLGEILDPLNDLIERFSSFVLYALAGLGLQKLVLIATSSLVMKVVTTMALLTGFIVWVLFGTARHWAVRLSVLVILVRFFFVIEVGTISVLDKLYFDHQKEQAHTALEIARDQLSDLRTSYMNAVTEGGFFSGSWNVASSLIGDDNQQGVTDLAAGAIVELIVIMLVRGMLLPLLFVWLLIRCGQVLLRSTALESKIPVAVTE